MRTAIRLYVFCAALAIVLLPFACTPARAAEIKSCVAIKATEPRLPEGVQRAWGQQSKFWPQRSTLRVRFLSGTEKQAVTAWKRFAHLDKLVNLTFVRVTTGASEIRVRFDANKGHWSYLGTDCRTIPQSSATMNLELTAGIFGSSSEEWSRVTWHEIGHSLGLSHEMQHPFQIIPWNKAAVYSYYARTQGWSRSQIDFQVLNQGSALNFVGTRFDKDSIMCYPLPKELLTDPAFAVGWNSTLSIGDIAFLRQIYP